MHLIAQGNSLYASFTVYDNFMDYSAWSAAGMYEEVSGTELGGHGVAVLGYGLLNGKEYWQIQNSWSRTWADHGFAKIRRGINLCHVESNAYYFSAWVTGGLQPAPPPCVDLTKSGISVEGHGSVNCSEVVTNQWQVNLCTHATTGVIVKQNCRASCGECTSAAPTPSPRSGMSSGINHEVTAAASPAPQPNIPTAAPTHHTTLTGDGTSEATVTPAPTPSSIAATAGQNGANSGAVPIAMLSQTVGCALFVALYRLTFVFVRCTG